MDQAPKWVRIAFFALCTISASSWLLPPVETAAQSAAITAAYVVLSLTGALSFFANRGRSGAPGPASPEHSSASRRAALLACVSSVGAVGLPLLLFGWAGSSVEPASAVAMLALCPVASAMTEAFLRGEALGARLLPCLLAAAGVFFLVPVAEPTSPASFTGLLLAIAISAVIGVSAALSGPHLRAMQPSRALFLAASANAAVLLVVALPSLLRLPNPSSLVAEGFLRRLIFEVCVGALTLTLLRSAPSLMYVTRYLWTPLILAVEGYVFLRPGITWRIALGACLVVLGTIPLWHSREDMPYKVLPLR